MTPARQSGSGDASLRWEVADPEASRSERSAVATRAKMSVVHLHSLRYVLIPQETGLSAQGPTGRMQRDGFMGDHEKLVGNAVMPLDVLGKS